MKTVAGTLKLELAQYREVESFSKFGADLDSSTLQILNKGSRLVQLLKQKQFKPLSLGQQIVIFFSAKENYLNKLDVNSIPKFESVLLSLLESNYSFIMADIKEAKVLNAKLEKNLHKICKEALSLC
jgi:F0F1-type ATP synthase alpha subunit